MIDLGNKRELFFDDHLIDVEKTTAQKRLHKARRAEAVLPLDMPWEGDLCGYPSIIKDDGLLRLYYRCSASGTSHEAIAYAESRDGIHWERPELGLCEFRGSKANNLLFDIKTFPEITRFDNTCFFKDTNPDCPPDQRYKSVFGWHGHHCIATLLSPDGIHWRLGEPITEKGAFDSQNLAFYDRTRGKYFSYYRGESHDCSGGRVEDKSLPDAIINNYYDPEKRAYNMPDEHERYYRRTVWFVESEDYKSWSEPKEIDFGKDAWHCQLYTNAIQPYPRAEHIFVGLPVRYVERKGWSSAYDELCGSDQRRTIMTHDAPRSGLALTDTIFIATRDGEHFTKYDEAIVPPPPEFKGGWVYGDGFFAPGLVETKSDLAGGDNEYSIYAGECYRSYRFVTLRRYVLRLDGFVSLHAGGKEETVVTKPFTYNGSELYANIATSAIGYIEFTLESEDGESFCSAAMFGNSTDKRIRFEDDGVRKLCGKTVTLKIRMLDADLYSIKFE